MDHPGWDHVESMLWDEVKQRSAASAILARITSSAEWPTRTPPRRQPAPCSPFPAARPRRHPIQAHCVQKQSPRPSPSSPTPRWPTHRFLSGYHSWRAKASRRQRLMLRSRRRAQRAPGALLGPVLVLAQVPVRMARPMGPTASARRHSNKAEIGETGSSWPLSAEQWDMDSSV